MAQGQITQEAAGWHGWVIASRPGQCVPRRTHHPQLYRMAQHVLKALLRVR